MRILTNGNAEVVEILKSFVDCSDDDLHDATVYDLDVMGSIKQDDSSS